MTKYKAFSKGKVTDLTHMTTRGMRAYHGDVIIVRCEETDIPGGWDALTPTPQQVLAEGEHSGHAHALFSENDVSNYFVPPTRVKLGVIEGGKDTNTATFEVRVTANKEMFLRIENEPKLLRHQEHNPFRLPPGFFEIGVQKERDPNGDIRAVVD